MKGIILAAGQGSRMGSKTDDKPKCMITYKGKPLINYTIDAMRACGIKDIIIVNGYKKDILVSHLGNSNIRFITNANYKKKNEFTVNIVLIRNRHSVSGIVFFLAFSLIYTGSLNEG